MRSGGEGPTAIGRGVKSGLERPSNAGVDVRLSDIATVLAVSRYQSVRKASEELRVTPSQVSKAVARVERWNRRAIFDRTGSQFRLLPGSARVIAQLEEGLRVLRAPTEVDVQFGIVSPSYLGGQVERALAGALGTTRVRLFTATSSFVRAYAKEGLFDAALLFDKTKLHKRWEARTVAKLRYALYGAPEVVRRIGKSPAASRIARERFVLPIYASGRELFPGQDNCPIPRDARRAGHEADSFSSALDVASVSEELVFGPVVAATKHVALDLLREIPVRGWNVTGDLVLHVDAERVSAAIYRAAFVALRSAFEAEVVSSSS